MDPWGVGEKPRVLGRFVFYCFFFFNDTATTEIYTLSLHDALPILDRRFLELERLVQGAHRQFQVLVRSEEHTSELQSPCNLVCRLLLEKKQHNGGLPPVCWQGDARRCHEVRPFLP